MMSSPEGGLVLLLEKKECDETGVSTIPAPILLFQDLDYEHLDFSKESHVEVLRPIWTGYSPTHFERFLQGKISAG